jgi:peptidoglycan/xylan/chitin deacetylase (PgdA/CDA1 family)
MTGRSILLNQFFPNHRRARSSKCIIFRLDDVKDYCCSVAQIAVMDLFIAKGHTISLGLEMNSIGGDKALMEKILQGNNKGLWELCLHGWAHEDYSKLNKVEQENLLRKCNTEMQNLFRCISNVFIPPYNRFNNHTLTAMTKLGIGIISSATHLDKQFFPVSRRSRSHDIVHIPETTTFEIFHHDKVYRVPVERILQDVDKSLDKYGFAVITLHPISFMKLERGKYTQSIDERQFDDLSLLTESLISKNISITTFSEIRDQLCNRMI